MVAAGRLTRRRDTITVSWVNQLQSARLTALTVVIGLSYWSRPPTP